MSTAMPISSLERRALEERSQLHERASELKTKVQHVRENLDIQRNARQYFGPAAAIAGAGSRGGSGHRRNGHSAPPLPVSA